MLRPLLTLPLLAISLGVRQPSVPPASQQIAAARSLSRRMRRLVVIN